MKAHTIYLTFNTKKRKEIIPITDQVESIIRDSGIQEGFALVSAMHVTTPLGLQTQGLLRIAPDGSVQAENP